MTFKKLTQIILSSSLQYTHILEGASSVWDLKSAVSVHGTDLVCWEVGTWDRLDAPERGGSHLCSKEAGPGPVAPTPSLQLRGCVSRAGLPALCCWSAPVTASS